MKKIMLVCLLGFSSSSYALFCPNSFEQVNIGDSKEQVIAACGKPTTERAIDGESNQPQEWNYYLKLNPTDPASIKTSIGFADGKVTNISVNGVGITNSSICGTTIEVGDTQDEVKAACGKPAFILQNNGNTQNVQASPETPKQVELIYQNDNGQRTIFVFENGFLKQRL